MKNILVKMLVIIILSSILSKDSFAKEAYDTPKGTLSPLTRSDKNLITGWFDMEPYYVMNKGEGGMDHLTGLDAELVKAIMKASDYNAEYHFIQLGDQVNNLKAGYQHFAASATVTEERKNFVYFSEAYRKEENSFYVRKGDSIKYSFKTGDMKGFMEDMKKNNTKIAIIRGWIFASKEINDFIADPNNKKHFVETNNTYENIELLSKGAVDGFIDDRILASTAIWRTKNSSKIEEVYLGIYTPIHFMFSKKLVSPAVVEDINNGIKKIREDGTYSRIISEYLFPVLILQTIEKPWFFFLEAFAIMALVISGLLIAYREKFNIYGTLLIAFVSMSGGIIRDVLVNRPKLGIMLSPIYAIAIVVAVFIGFIVVWGYQLLFKHEIANLSASILKEQKKHLAKIGEWFIDLLDAFGLAAYTVTGVIIALTSQLDPLWLWGPILAVLTTTGGGIMRDVIRGHKDIPTLKHDFYGEIAIIWGLILSLALSWNAEIMSPDEMFKWIVFVVIGNFITRMFVRFIDFKGLRFNLKGLD
jgi:polar amino acid transport system substrate-binding protein